MRNGSTIVRNGWSLIALSLPRACPARLCTTLGVLVVQGAAGHGRYPVARPAVHGYRGRVLTPPDGLPETVLVSALGRSWGMAVTSMEYRAVGWGSHHWAVADAAGARWFVTV